MFPLPGDGWYSLQQFSFCQIWPENGFWILVSSYLKILWIAISSISCQPFFFEWVQIQVFPESRLCNSRSCSHLQVFLPFSDLLLLTAFLNVDAIYHIVSLTRTGLISAYISFFGVALITLKMWVKWHFIVKWVESLIFIKLNEASVTYFSLFYLIDKICSWKKKKYFGIFMVWNNRT